MRQVWVPVTRSRLCSRGGRTNGVVTQEKRRGWLRGSGGMRSEVTAGLLAETRSRVLQAMGLLRIWLEELRAVAIWATLCVHCEGKP